MVTTIQLIQGVEQAYSAAARDPDAKHPFPVGRPFAIDVGYPESLLESIPSAAVQAFAGVSNVAVYAELPGGARVLDLGCGSGLDCLVAAQRVGPSGTVVGVDFSEDMIARARRAVTEAGVRNVELRIAGADALPLEPASFDVALVNGIFNLNPNRDGVFEELARVIKPGGAVYASELVLLEDRRCATDGSLKSWFS